MPALALRAFGRKNRKIPVLAHRRRAAKQLRGRGRPGRHPCDCFEQPGQRGVAICTLLHEESVEKRAPRRVDLAQRGMYAPRKSPRTSTCIF
jgi:hypothetical protein